MMNDRISTRIDPELKQNAAAIFAQLGLSEAEAIRIFYAQVTHHNGLPFEVKIPNEETIAALNEPLEKMQSYTLEEFEQYLDGIVAEDDDD
jgi:DNA-damage-inducible protein J